MRSLGVFTQTYETFFERSVRLFPSTQTHLPSPFFTLPRAFPVSASNMPEPITASTPTMRNGAQEPLVSTAVHDSTPSEGANRSPPKKPRETQNVYLAPTIDDKRVALKLYPLLVGVASNN